MTNDSNRFWGWLASEFKSKWRSCIFKEDIHSLIFAPILLVSACLPSSAFSLTGRFHLLIHNSFFVNFTSDVLWWYSIYKYIIIYREISLPQNTGCNISPTETFVQFLKQKFEILKLNSFIPAIFCEIW